MLGQRPLGGSRTQRVWEIADELTQQTGSLARRKDVIARFVDEGGNRNTAATQYQKWKGELQRRSPLGPDGTSAADRSERPLATTDPVRLNVGADGRVVIPIELRRAMVLEGGGTVSARVVDGVLHLWSRPVGIWRARALFKATDNGDGSIVDDLLRERAEDRVREERSDE